MGISTLINPSIYIFVLKLKHYFWFILPQVFATPLHGVFHPPFIICHTTSTQTIHLTFWDSCLHLLLHPFLKTSWRGIVIWYLKQNLTMVRHHDHTIVWSLTHGNTPLCDGKFELVTYIIHVELRKHFFNISV